MDELQGHYRCDMVLGSGIISKPKMDLCLTNNTARLTGGTYEGCTTPMKGTSKINFNFSSNFI